MISFSGPLVFRLVTHVGVVELVDGFHRHVLVAEYCLSYNSEGGGRDGAFLKSCDYPPSLIERLLNVSEHV